LVLGEAEFVCVVARFCDKFDFPNRSGIYLSVTACCGNLDDDVVLGIFNGDDHGIRG
jgi:hypothetical protein